MTLEAVLRDYQKKEQISSSANERIERKGLGEDLAGDFDHGARDVDGAGWASVGESRRIGAMAWWNRN